MSGQAKEVRKLVETAREQGWSVRLNRGGHWRFAPRAGGRLVFTGSTPSDRRGLKNLRRDLQHAGLRLP